MDGLTISSANKFLETGKTGSEIRSDSVNLPKPIGPAEPSFADTLKDAVNSVNTMQKQSDVEMQKISTGKSDNIHEVMIAAEKADIALKLMVQMRNKMIEAYQDIMKMQV
jgi:flagellar hook-basal body complex protein FliE